MDLKVILNQTRELRLEGRIQDSFDLIMQEYGRLNEGALLLLQHNPMFWKSMAGGICTITRRSANDANFLRELWENTEFLYSFHRHAPKLPNDDQQLIKILQNEYAALISERRAIHWIVRDRLNTPWGLLSLQNISPINKSAEVMLGVLPEAPMGLSTAAMLILFQFYFKKIKFNKLVSLIYEDNIKSLKGTLHLGFKQEGRLVRHVIDPRSSKYVDLIQTGIFEKDAFSTSNIRLMNKLLKKRD